MASVMQPLLVAAVPEILHLDAKSNHHCASVSASTTASSRSTSPGDSEDKCVRPSRRSKTIGAIDAAELDMEYPSGLTVRDLDDAAPLLRSKTCPGLDDKGLTEAYPADLIVRNTFLEFVDEPVFLQLRKVKSAPSSPVAGKAVADSPVAGKVAEFLQRAPALLDLASMLETTPQSGNQQIPSVGSQSPVAAKATELAPRVPAVLHLASVLDTAPKLGSPEMPTIGSAEHHLGLCKPCAFFWKPSGCSNGVDCIYCHLCDAKEKKRRQKEKKALLKGQGQTVENAK